MKAIELLAPAGNMESFYQAINAGADAIYLSGKSFGARSYAQNFTEKELKEAIQLGKIYGVKVYVTMNTLIKEKEGEEFLQQVEFLYQNGIDAILMQDFGMICLCLEKYPNLEIHASTQFNSSSVETIDLLAKLGVKRVVLPREMTKEEIKEIKTSIEKEIFIHGALCVSYSGNCLMSQMQGGRSGNRGECAGCCRLPYQLFLKDQKIKEGYLLSMKDLNVSDHLEELTDLVDSLKIEGRMKSPTYVYYVTKYYHDLLHGKEPKEEERKRLQSIFYRGNTLGHLFHAKDLMNQDYPNHIGLPIGKVIKITDKEITIKLEEELSQEDGIRFLESKKGMTVNFLSDQKGNFISKGEKGQLVTIDNKVNLTTYDQVHLTNSKRLEKSLSDIITKKVLIEITFEASIGKAWNLTFKDDKNHQVTYTGTIVEEAKTAPLEPSRIKEQLEKLGNSPFTCSHIEMKMDENIFLRIGELNMARRTLCERLVGERINDYKEPIILEEKKKEKKESMEKVNYQEYEEIPRNLFHVTKALKEKSIVHEIIEIPKGIKAIGATSLNVFNSYTAYYLFQHGYGAISLSTELTEEEQEDLCQQIHIKYGSIPIFIQSKGRVEVMAIKGNPLELKENILYQLIDPKKNSYPVFYDGRLTHIKSSYELQKKEENFGKDVYYF